MNKFYDTVIAMNPRLRKEQRVNPAIVEQLLASFDTHVKGKKTVNYDDLLATIAKSLDLPEALVEPFVETYVTAYISLTSRKFVRHCDNCQRTHTFTASGCLTPKDLIVKTKAGFIVVDGEDRPERFRN